MAGGQAYGMLSRALTSVRSDQDRFGLKVQYDTSVQIY